MLTAICSNARPPKAAPPSPLASRQAPMADVIGIDFGTTNSVIALRQADGQVASIRYEAGAGVVDTFRSLLCFWADETGQVRRPNNE